MLSSRHDRPTPPVTVWEPLASPAPILLERLRSQSLILPEDWEGLPAEVRHEVEQSPDRSALLGGLVRHGLLTDYQADRLRKGQDAGLVLGNYRVLSRLGAGGMGVVYKAEHLRLRHLVAIKVLALARNEDPYLLLRFYAEMRAVARLRHPNVVGALDAGEAADPDPDGPILHYFVMEYVPGRDLEEHVLLAGPLPVGVACELASQVASALTEAHKHQLVHRDVKPSNILITEDGQAKLLDFGLARHFRTRMTEPGTLLGTVDFMAPEQALDSSTVDIRADIYGLGGTLFWCLTGQLPFPSQGSVHADLLARWNQDPPSLRDVRPDLPAELGAVIARMMARTVAERYATPQDVIRALQPFLAAAPTPIPGMSGPPLAAPSAGGGRVLVVDDEPDLRAVAVMALAGQGLTCAACAGGAEALDILNCEPYDLALLDVDMPDMNGIDVLRRLRAGVVSPYFKIILCSGSATADDMARLLAAGADDFLSKPYTLAQLLGRVQAALRLKEAQDRTETLNRHLLAVTLAQERTLATRDSDLLEARAALVLALAQLVEQRTTEGGGHLQRLQRYCRCLAEEAATAPAFAERIDADFVRMLECCVPLHDVGTVALPDHILMKPGKFDPEERLLMQSHTTLGADTLTAVIRQHGFARPFLQMAVDVCRHHHERWDGTGYPDRLAGEAIPLSARIAAVADTYDALRCRRSYRPAFPHTGTMQVVAEQCAGWFDPQLLQVFHRCAPQFERIFRDGPN